MRDFVKRLALALAALDFKRVYGIGAVALALMLLSQSDTALNNEWTLIVLVFAASPVATLISEGVFALVLYQAKSVPVPFSFVRVETERTITKTYGKDEPETVREKVRILTPVPTPTGGIKQVLRCFLSQSFSSYCFGYAPYSGFVGPEKSTWLAEGTRVTVLAKAADASDFEHLEYRAFQMKRVTDGCWILVRQPLSRSEGKKALAAISGPTDVVETPGWH